MQHKETRDFAAFLRKRGVKVTLQGGLFDQAIETEEDLSPHMREWRIWRGEAVWT